MKKLIIAEKPSVARNIADAVKAVKKENGYIEGAEYIITWAFGHLLQLYDGRDYDEKMKSWRMEYFPFVPDEFFYKIKSDSREKGKIDVGAERQIQLIQKLSQREDVSGIVSATDDDREGQIIADEIFLYLKIEKPIERLLLNEWTEEEVLRGLANLKSNQLLQSLQDAGMGRQYADWLIGINLTSVATVKYKNVNKSKILNVGRVLMPTLKIIYDRDKEIENFESSKYYKMTGVFKTQKEEPFEGIYFQENNEKFLDKAFLEKLIEGLINKPATVISKITEKKKDYPPRLFNLSNLQGFITSKYNGWTADKVLKIAQKLYEKKLITYPRTSSQVLDESLIEKVRKVFNTHKTNLRYEKELNFQTSKRVFDSSKVESHSAIIPTYLVARNLSEDERNLYDAVFNRFMCQFMPLAEYEETVIEIKPVSEEIQGLFQVKGKIVLEEGWKKVEKIETKEVMLPILNENDQLILEEVKISEVVKKPPKPHTEKTLLRVMETCGKGFEDEDSEEIMMAILAGFSIGTPATRAETIKKLKDAGYITTKGKSLICTTQGRMMVETFPVKELFDLEYTGRLEKTLSDIEKERFTKKEFLDIIIEFVGKSVEEIKESTIFGVVSGESDILGKCPECGNPVVENSKGFGCSNWKKGCKFTIWKDDKYIHAFGKEVSAPMVKILLEHGRVGFHGCVSKNKNKFSAYFRYNKNKETGRYSWSMEFIPRNQKGRS